MSAERGWIVEPQPPRHGVEEWVAHHRSQGHNPHPAPTNENPEQWLCKCDPDAAWTAVWRILTLEQIRQKFAHLELALREGEESRRRTAKLEQDLRTAVPSPPDPPLSLASGYAAGRPWRRIALS